MATSSLLPIAILVDELKHDDPKLRLNSVRGIKSIALALGTERTQKELIPYLTQITRDDEDEILITLAKILGDFVTEIGGPAEVWRLVPLLLSLSASDETIVRESGVQSLTKIFPHLSDTYITSDLFPTIKTYSKSNYYPKRACAANIIPLLSTHLPKNDDIFQLFIQLTKDKSPIVRKYCIQQLPLLVKSFQKNPERTETLFQAFQSALQDTQDSLRVHAVCVASEILPLRDSTVDNLIPFVSQVIGDASWRVRYSLGQHFVSFAEPLLNKEPQDATVVNLLSKHFLKLLNDSEPDVRVVALSRLAQFSARLPFDRIIQSFLPVVLSLASDSVMHVRSAVAECAVDFSSVFDPEPLKLYFLPLVHTLLQDPHPEVRLKVLHDLSALTKAIGISNIIDQLLPSILELGNDPQWRVRYSVISYLPSLAPQLGPNVFKDQLKPVLRAWFHDSCYCVRDATTVLFKRLLSIFGSNWGITNIIPDILLDAQHDHFLFRLTVVFSLSLLIPLLPADFVTESLVPVFITLSKDPVPNIRLNTAKCLTTLLPHFSKDVLQKSITPVIDALTIESEDSDVRYYASQAKQLLISQLE